MILNEFVQPKMEALETRGCHASDVMVEQATWPPQRGLN